MIYLDHNATTPIAPEVRKAMMRYIESEFGNPSSNYPLGKRARVAVEEARSQVAAFVGGQPSEIIFTSGGTESSNHVIKGIAEHYSGKKDHMITTKIEHPAVLEPMLHLAVTYGWKITFINVDRDGRIDPDDVKKAITSRDGTRFRDACQQRNRRDTAGGGCWRNNPECGSSLSHRCRAERRQNRR